MNISDALHRYWRIWAVAGLGALLAFTGSYIVSPTYEASTRVIIHGRDAGFLTSSGTTDPGQPQLMDSGQAKALADTYGSIATSRGLAEAVVDRLRLHEREDDSGILHVFTAGAAWVYRCGRAFVTFGFCASVDPYERAVAEVQEGTTALQIGTTAGATAGQPGAYVLEVTASGETGAQAQAVADAVADELVRTSAALVRTNAEEHIARLEGQLEEARAAVRAAASVVTAFEQANNVSAADQETVVTATSYSDLRAELNSARADLADTQARLATIEATLQDTAATVSSDQRIDTGRSGTSITTNQSNPVYDDLLSARSEARARITGLEARIGVLEGQVADGSPVSLSGTLAELADLQADLRAAETNRAEITALLGEARTQAATAAPDLTRLDAAGRPDYPVSPKRYLYGLIGLLLGGLAGAALTWLARRAGEGESADAEHDPGDLDTLALADQEDGSVDGAADDEELVVPRQEPLPTLNGGAATAPRP